MFSLHCGAEGFPRKVESDCILIRIYWNELRQGPRWPLTPGQKAEGPRTRLHFLLLLLVNSLHEHNSSGLTGFWLNIGDLCDFLKKQSGIMRQEPGSTGEHHEDRRGDSNWGSCIQKQAANLAVSLGLIWINWCYLCLWYSNAEPGGGSSHETSGHLGEPSQVQSCHGLICLPQ